jgi:hypothetical protein
MYDIIKKNSTAKKRNETKQDTTEMKRNERQQKRNETQKACAKLFVDGNVGCAKIESWKKKNIDGYFTRTTQKR